MDVNQAAAQMSAVHRADLAMQFTIESGRAMAEGRLSGALYLLACAKLARCGHPIPEPPDPNGPDAHAHWMDVTRLASQVTEE